MPLAKYWESITSFENGKYNSIFEIFISLIIDGLMSHLEFLNFRIVTMTDISYHL